MIEVALCLLSASSVAACCYLARLAFLELGASRAAYGALAETALRTMKANNVGEAVQAKFMEDVNKVTVQAQAKKALEPTPPKTQLDSKGPPKTIKTADGRTLEYMEFGR